MIITNGKHFLQLIEQKLDRCADGGRHDDAYLESIGTLLCVLDFASSCGWGCRGGNHAVEALLARCVSYSLAALHLAPRGLYDETLSLVRTVGEGANLLCLFVHDPSTMSSWETLREDTAWKTFSPKQVRMRLEKLGKAIPIDRQRYGTLSYKATHPTPNVHVQMYNTDRVALVGGTYQEAGFSVCAVELAIAVLATARCAHLALKLPDEAGVRVLSAGDRLEALVQQAQARVNKHFPGTYSSKGPSKQS